MLSLFLLVLVASAIITYNVINRGEELVVIEKEDSKFPLLSIQQDNREINLLEGYVQAMNVVSTADKISLLGSDRKIEAIVNAEDTKVTKVTYEIRNNDGTRLIQSGEAVLGMEKDGKYEVSFICNDLISLGSEYIVVFIVDTDIEQGIHYYTRILYQEGLEDVIQDQIEYVEAFHNATFSEDGKSVISVGLEPNWELAETNPAKVNIHSAIDKVMWQGIEVVQVKETELNITYLAGNQVAYTLEYEMLSKEGEVFYQQGVVEKYYLNTVGDRIYLLEYEREIETKYQIENSVYEDDTISLGYQQREPQIMENESGDIAAFSVNNSLYFYYDSVNEIHEVWTSSEEKQMLEILSVDETGNIYFVVAGYLNQGVHEGNSGLVLYYYDNSLHVVNEIFFLRSDESPMQVLQELEEVLFLTTNGFLYVLLDGNLCKINLESRELELVFPGKEGRKFVSSKDGEQVAIIDNNQLQIMDLSTEIVRTISGDHGEIVVFQGFMNRDLVYGLANKEEAYVQNDGSEAYYFKSIQIEDVSGNLVKAYEYPEIRIISTSFEENQIRLERVEYKDTSVEAIADDTILASIEEDTRQNTMIYEDQVWVDLMHNITLDTLEHHSCDGILRESTGEVIYNLEYRADYYISSSPWEVLSYVDESSLAIEEAMKTSGNTRDQEGLYLWRSQSIASQKQINQPELAVAGMENQELISFSSEYLSPVLFYISEGVPVIVVSQTMETQAIIGYNQFNITLLNLETEETSLMGRKDAEQAFLEAKATYRTLYQEKAN